MNQKTRYIIGLIPLKPTIYTETAQSLLSEMSDGYLLSSSVFPHITVAQFELNDEEKARLQILWEEIAKLNIKPFSPKLIGVSFIKGLKSHDGFYWAQLAVERDPLVMKTHHQVVDVLNKHQLSCLNDAGDIYKPHITLARITLSKSIPLWTSELLAAQEFRIAIGASDKNGRYLKTVYE